MNYLKEIEKLCFFRQKICNHLKSDTEYELLLRYKGDDGYYFPKELFDKLLNNKVYHRVYIEHIEKLLNYKLSKDDSIYSLNLNYQELYYEETLEFLKKFKYKERLKVELTEHVPLSMRSGSEINLPLGIVERIKELGYSIALDDFLTGMNTFETLFCVSTSINRVKISILKLKSFLSSEELNMFLSSIVESISFLDKEIVIEAVEDQSLLNKFPREWIQQTYFYNIPHKF